MYCKYCGKEINDDADVCVHCGRSTNRIPSPEKETGETKAGVGILLCLFLGLIGLIIGVVA
ncbi:MAG: zinc ribbon domain-containing protein, partial [Clostridia bacterium]|nr:zinc ribbon domain-containing protein [Clostridia bacterium]